MKLYWTLVSAAMVGAALNDTLAADGRLLSALAFIYWKTHS